MPQKQPRVIRLISDRWIVIVAEVVMPVGPTHRRRRRKAQPNLISAARSRIRQDRAADDKPPDEVEALTRACQIHRLPVRFRDYYTASLLAGRTGEPQTVPPILDADERGCYQFQQ